jgi:DNA-binding transcriptional regulator YhcF (GntR family)
MSEFDPNVPIYSQIMNAIKLDIIKGTRKAGDKLLSVRELAETMTVNPNTVQRAYQELEREGITETRRGMGTFIMENENLKTGLKHEMAKSVMKDFIDGMRALGYENDAIIKELDQQLEGGHN